MLQQKKPKNKYVISFCVVNANDRSRWLVDEVWAYSEKQARFILYKRYEPKRLFDMTTVHVKEGTYPINDDKPEQLTLF